MGHGNTQIYTTRSVQFSKPYTKLYSGKSTERLHTNLVIAIGFLFLLLIGVTVQLVRLSFESDEQKQQLQINRELLQHFIKLHIKEFPKSNTASRFEKQFKDNLENFPVVDDLTRGDRNKRSTAYRRGGPCHLEGRPGPNALSKYVSQQRPASINQSILWKTDRETPSVCLMETEYDVGNHGIQYIKIPKKGFYNVYAQLTYDVGSVTPTGYSIDVSRVGSTTRKTLLRTRAPWQTPKDDNTMVRAQESSYTAGVFYLKHGERISVHPIKPLHRFVMTESESFFGAIYLGD